MKNRRSIAWLITFVLIITMLFPLGNASAADILQQTNPVSGGLNHTLAIKKDGTVWAWGSNKEYQLGLSSSVTEALTPKQIEGFTAVSVAAGSAFSAALQQSGFVYVWGYSKEQYPHLVTGIDDVVAISASDNDILALRKDGAVWQWAAAGGTPARVAGLDSIVTISASGSHYLALSYSGDVWAWGSNTFGQLGIGTNTNQRAPVKIDGLVNIVQISAGFSHSLAISENGKVFAWGNNSSGELGIGTSENSMTPKEVGQITKAVRISAGKAFSMALTADSKLYTWGYGEYSQLAHSSIKISSNTPGSAVISSTPVFIGSGMSHAFYCDASGNLYIWGRNNSNQLGTGVAANENAPVKILSGILTSQEYKTVVVGGASQWATDELSKLYEMNIVPRLLWSNYKNYITRAELAYLLVTLHEQILQTTIKPGGTATFTDIKGHMLEESIKKANFMDIINGISDTQFSPDTSTTREQAAKMISIFVEKTKQTSVEFDNSGPLTYYSDAKNIGAWAIPYVAYAHENGIMKGSSDNLFNPRGLLTREEAMVMMYRTLVEFGWVR